MLHKLPFNTHRSKPLNEVSRRGHVCVAGFDGDPEIFPQILSECERDVADFLRGHGSGKHQLRSAFTGGDGRVTGSRGGAAFLPALDRHTV